MTTKRLTRLIGVAAILAIGAMPPAAFGDGVVEINTACINTGCFSGDDTGYPVEITQPGSYRLTSNINVNQNTTAISITADDVTLDLNGFAVRGVTSCETTSPPNCSSTGIGNGIESDNNNTAILNGSVSHIGSDCIELNGSGHVSDVRIAECGGNGLWINAGMVENVAVYTVASYGIGNLTSVAYVRESLVRSANVGINVGACDDVVIQAAESEGGCTNID